MLNDYSCEICCIKIVKVYYLCLRRQLITINQNGLLSYFTLILILLLLFFFFTVSEISKISVSELKK